MDIVYIMPIKLKGERCLDKKYKLLGDKCLFQYKLGSVIEICAKVFNYGQVYNEKTMRSQEKSGVYSLDNNTTDGNTAWSGERRSA